MKIIDRKGRLFGKVSLLDLLIVAVVVAVALVGYNLLFGENTVTSLEDSQKTVRYTVEMREVRESILTMPEEGGPAFNSSRNYHIGDIVSWRHEPHQEAIQNYDEGTYEWVERDDQYLFYITIEAQADINDFGIRVGQQEIRIGDEIPLKGKGFASLGYIVGIEIEGEDF